MHHSWWSYNKRATPQRRENPKILRETKPFDSYVWVPATTMLCSIFLPVLFKAIPCIGKDLGMCTIAYASLMVELQQDMYTGSHLYATIFIVSVSYNLLDSLYSYTNVAIQTILIPKLNLCLFNSKHY